MAKIIIRIKLFLAGFIINFTKLIIGSPTGVCRHHPTCSVYAQEALKTLPLYKAVPKIIYRLFRCNPFTNNSFDPVNLQKDNK